MLTPLFWSEFYRDTKLLAVFQREKVTRFPTPSLRSRDIKIKSSNSTSLSSGPQWMRYQIRSLICFLYNTVVGVELQVFDAMDPFSVVVGVGSLIEMSLQLGKFLKNVYEAAASFEGEVGSLLREIQDLSSVNKSIENLHRAEIGESSERQLPRQDLDIWQNTVKTLQECSETIKRLQRLLEDITGKGGAKVTGWRDGFKKQLRKQSKDGELKDIRIKLSVHRDSLNVSLTLLNL